MQTGILLYDFYNDIYNKKKHIEKFNTKGGIVNYLKNLFEKFSLYVYGFICLVLAIKYANCYFPDNSSHLIFAVVASPIYIIYLLANGIINCPKKI